MKIANWILLLVAIAGLGYMGSINADGYRHHSYNRNYVYYGRPVYSGYNYSPYYGGYYSNPYYSGYYYYPSYYYGYPYYSNPGVYLNTPGVTFGIGF